MIKEELLNELNYCFSALQIDQKKELLQHLYPEELKILVVRHIITSKFQIRAKKAATQKHDTISNQTELVSKIFNYRYIKYILDCLLISCPTPYKFRQKDKEEIEEESFIPDQFGLLQYLYCIYHLIHACVASLLQLKYHTNKNQISTNSSNKRYKVDDDDSPFLDAITLENLIQNFQIFRSSTLLSLKTGFTVQKEDHEGYLLLLLIEEELDILIKHSSPI